MFSAANPSKAVVYTQPLNSTPSASFWPEVEVIPKQSTAVPQSWLEAHSVSAAITGWERTVVDSHQVRFSMREVMHPIAAL
jgi:hypothetical protein